MAYDIDQVTSTFNSLTEQIKNQLNEQFELGRIKGTDYANVYSSLMNTALQLSFETPIKEAQVEQIKKQTSIMNR